jgi:hypothetical protein
MAEGNSQYAVNIAKELSSRLVASEARVAELEGRLAELEVEVQVYRDRSEQAEQWLNKISSELQTRIVGKAEWNSNIPGTSPLGRPIEKVGLFALFVPDKQPNMPAAADPPTAVADLPHLLWIAVPMPPELRIGADLNGVHAFGDWERFDLSAHVCGSHCRPS